MSQMDATDSPTSDPAIQSTGSLVVLPKSLQQDRRITASEKLGAEKLVPKEIFVPLDDEKAANEKLRSEQVAAANGIELWRQASDALRRQVLPRDLAIHRRSLPA